MIFVDRYTWTEYIVVSCDLWICTSKHINGTACIWSKRVHAVSASMVSWLHKVQLQLPQWVAGARRAHSVLVGVKWWYSRIIV